jgi:hypothetical protein
LVALRSDDKTKIEDALTMVDMNRPICAEARARVVTMFAQSLIFRGNPDVPNSPDDDHEAQARIGPSPFIHINQSVLDSMPSSYIAQLLLHEAWHVINTHGHHEGEGSAPYSAYPYSEQASCVVNNSY